MEPPRKPDGPSLKPLGGPIETESLGNLPAKVQVRRFRMIPLDGGRPFLSGARRVVIGSDPSVDLRLEDRTVSRFHCEILLGDEGVTVRDLGSTNGTLVNEVPVLHAHLRGGAVLSLGNRRLRFEIGDERVEVPVSTRTRFGALVGRSEVMRAAFELLERAAAVDTTVLLEGETGTGKDAAAESIHRESPRAVGPFVVVDCGAIPAGVLESELFGHARGAFTGAVASRTGAFEAATGGTLFLDEIGELDRELQPTLLRVLEKREVKRVGEDTPRSVDVRVVAATRRDLRAEVNAGRFRPDLYYRLAVLVVRLPPLRERLQDVPLLVDAILGKLGAEEALAAALRAPAFLAELARHTWPGNVRELRNYLERCAVLDAPAPLDESGGGPLIDPALPLRTLRERWTTVMERRYLEALLERHEGNVSAAARAAEVERHHLYRLLWKHGLR
jgi:DNA-binding NtrC family response regulator